MLFEEEELGEDFFEVTEQDVRTLWADAQRKLYVMCNLLYVISFFRISTLNVRPGVFTIYMCFVRREASEQPLMTKSMRESQRVEHLSRYERVAIRLQFSDQHVLQALFRPRETVHALYKFVAQNVKDADLDFYLCTYIFTLWCFRQ